jgi:signal transduction histidine kinase
MRIRTAIVWGTLVHSAIAAAACVALVLLTTVQHRRVSDLTSAMESFRRAADIEMALMLHRLTPDATARGAEEGALRELLDEMGRESPPDEQPLVGVLQRDVGLYLNGGAPETERSHFASSLLSARRLALEHVDMANDARSRAARTDFFATTLGGSLAVLMAFTVFVFLAWLWRSAFRPLFSLESAVERFGAGDANARAPEQGPEEFRRMARTFNTTASGLQRARQDQLRYTGAVLHDLRTPLSAIQLATQFVEPDRPLPAAERLRDLFGLIRRQVTRINGIIGDSLGVLRAQAGDMALRLDRADAVRIARDCVDQFLALTTHHKIELRAKSDALPLQCDVRRVEQLLNNLLSNAVKYSAPGTTIRVAAGEKYEGWIELSVSDQGRGIAPEDRERIFQPFQRAVSGHEEIPGVGLGLYVARSVAEAHGGKLMVESELGKGSTFHVLLPATPPVEAQSASSA